MRDLSITFFTFLSGTFSLADYGDSHIDAGCDRELISLDLLLAVHRCFDKADDDNIGKEGADGTVGFHDSVVVVEFYC